MAMERGLRNPRRRYYQESLLTLVELIDRERDDMPFCLDETLYGVFLTSRTALYNLPRINSYCSKIEFELMMCKNKKNDPFSGVSRRTHDARLHKEWR